ncbi:PX domain protein [Necator americanus]|uniref:PX domain protein n=1 Tax=Necator americanus TaxID=51031 RepID=W2TUH5_NECAM|nr:PX domain protein [Necator americanus]ETN84707.1 PX domain protein [Necator americanus]
MLVEATVLRRRSSIILNHSADHRLSVQDAAATLAHSHSRGTSGSRTDLSTDEEIANTQLSASDRRLSHRRRSSGRSGVGAADGLCESGRLSRNDRRQSAQKRRLSKNNIMVQETGNHVHDQRSTVSRSHSTGGAERQGPSKVNRNINRFSNFVKSGMEAYILGESRMNGQSGEKHEIIISGPLVQWRPIQQYYTCTVDKPKKETKLKGLKSFIAYSLTSTLSRIQVSRRYKHFDWLHDQLSAKYIMIAIPPLPEKQVSGRYEDDLIDHRKHILQLWVNKICRHPVLSQSEDEYVGGNFFNCVTVPQSPLDIGHVERQVEKFQRSVKTSEDAMRVMQERLGVFQKLFIGPVKSNWQKMALAFVTLAQSFHTDDHPGSNRMVDALKQTAHHYHQIGDDFEAHSKNDMEPVMESLYSFKGTIQTAPDILHVHKQAVQKYRECEGKLSHADADRIKRRVDSTSYAVLAEMNHLNTEKIEDVRITMFNYLKRQAEFYQKMANSLNDMAKLYEF